MFNRFFRNTVKKMFKLTLQINGAILSLLSLRARKRVMCIPDYCSEHSSINTKRYTQDNVLCIVNYFTRDQSVVNFDIILISYDEDLHNELEYFKKTTPRVNLKIITHYKAIQKIKDKAVSFVKYFYYLCSSKVILTVSPLEPLMYKNKRQVHIALNYYSPFKSDEHLTLDENTVDYVITTSKISALIDSQVSKVPVKNYQILGFPRNDYILNPRFSRREVLNLYGLDVEKKILLYTPTHRTNIPGDNERIVGVKDLKSLNDMLIKYSAILLIKDHELINNNNKDIASNIRVFDKKIKLTVYDLIPHVDILITDYTSLYFDFILTGKPVIFNFIDRDIYEKERGFSYDPIEAMCAGDIVKTEEGLISAIEAELTNSGYDNSQHYAHIQKLTNKHIDSHSTERVSKFIERCI